MGFMVRSVIVVVALCLAVVGAKAQDVERAARDFDLGRATEILANMMREFDVSYVEDITADELLDAAAKGMIAATDPYTEYLSESALDDFELMTTGRSGGVGSLIRKRGDYVIFAQPYKGSPSDLAGIKIGDKILAIDGEDMRGCTTEDVSTRLKGEPESGVTVVVEHNIGAVVDTVRLQRRRISIPSVTYAGILRDGIGYVAHNDFIEDSYGEMRRAIEALMATDTLRGIILDYRSNGGGVMKEAVDIASLFVPRGSRVVSIMGRDSASLVHYDTRHAPIAEHLPIVVLVNGTSASASEILAGALQDMDRAVIMGSRTYGKGLVQSTNYLGYNTYLKLTTSKYYIPSGRCIQSRNYAAMRRDGASAEVPDSLISEFSTLGGRKVYDGGGIVPDVKVEPEYVSRFAITLYAMGYMDDWADKYMRSHHDRSIDVRTFCITDEDYADFVEYIGECDVPYESETRHALKALEKAVENDLYDEELQPIIAELKAKIKDDKLSNMETYRSEIIDALNSHIVLRYAYSEGVTERAAVDDEAVQRAIELLLDGDEYSRILSQQNLSMH